MARRSQAKTFPKQTVGINFDDTCIAAALQAFADRSQEAMRAGAYEAATVLYNEMRILVPVKSGTLRDSIYRYRDIDQSVDGKEVFYIGPNKNKAPHWHLVEFGTVKMAAKPYIRPAFDAKIQPALEAAKKRITEKLKELT